jgi:tetratricopeptide (TPR) repeat protein
MFSSRPDHWGLRPIVTTSLAIDYWLAGGLDPFYFHLSTFICYLFLGIVFFFICKKLYLYSLKDKRASYYAIITTAIFCFHTVNAETINYIISRSDVISTLCIMLSFGIFVYYPKLRKWFIYSIPAVIGVFAKETILVLPIILFFYILLFEKEISLTDVFKSKNRKASFKITLSLLPLFILIAVFQFYTLSKAGSISGFSNPILQYLQTQPYVWLHYFLSFFLPFNLSADSDWTVIPNFFDDRVVLGFIFIILLIYTIFKTSTKKRTRPIALGLIWFSASLLPTSIAPLAEVMNDHRMFLPFIGLTISVVYSLGLVANYYKDQVKFQKKYNTLIWSAVFIVLTAYAYGTYQRNKVWKNGETLWYDVTIKSPKNGRGLMNYGLTQMEKGNYQVALKYYKKALLYNPYYSSLYINIGIAKGALGHVQEAEESFKKGIQYDPNSDTSYYFYARFLLQKRRFQEAKDLAEKAYNITPYQLKNLYLLMELYTNLELWEDLKKTIDFTLNISSKNPIALKYQKIQKSKKSKLQIASDLVKSTPTPENLINLSLIYYNTKRYRECIEVCLRAIELDPNNHVAYNNICSSYTALNEFEEAIEACKKALSIKPDFSLAKNNLKFAESKLE